MMEAARSLGLAARFVTGYLYDTGTQGMVGGGATHAWCSIYLPGAGWVEYDPTNGLLAGTHLVRVASTRTPEQAIPMAGSFTGTPSDATASAASGGANSRTMPAGGTEPSRDPSRNHSGRNATRHGPARCAFVRVAGECAPRTECKRR